MIQAIIRNGKVFPEEVPSPIVEDGTVLIKVYYSCISTGTEIASIKSSKPNIFKKVLEQPERFIHYLNKIKYNGINKIYQDVKFFVKSGSPTGYSISGEVVAIGKGISKFNIGEKVAAVGGGYAYHAEFIIVPENLVIKIPQISNLVEISTVAIGGIAFHGVRRANLAVGEYCVVFGAGLIGIISIQILKLAGIRVIAIDINDDRLELAKKSGADFVINSATNDIVQYVNNLTGGYGCDAVIFTAATTSSEPLSLTFKMIRKKGKLVLVGSSGLEIKREDIYPKEIDFLIATSYGPGRYDKNYEEKGLDYPYSYIRWTQNRNMEEYCRLIAEGKLDLSITSYKLYNIEDVEQAYTDLQSETSKHLFAILEYSKNSLYKHKTFSINSNINTSLINVALIGTGSFAQNILIPNLKKLKNAFNLYTVMSRSGYNAKNVAEIFEANKYTSDFEEILKDKNVDLILICNRHKLHFDYVYKSLTEGKNVFVEKPLCTSLEQLKVLDELFFNGNKELPFIMVGYNRRFSPYAEKIKDEVKKRVNPLFMIYRMNVGYVPLDSWIHEDGGRIVGEACHIIDLMNYFTESKIVAVNFDSINPQNEQYSSSDNKSIILRYEDGSLCNIHYFAVGNEKLSKEYMELHFDGKSIIMDNYQQLYYYGINKKPFKTKNLEKGHLEELQILAQKLKNNELPIELWDLVQTSQITLNIS